MRLKDPFGLHTGAAAERHVAAQRSLHFLERYLTLKTSVFAWEPAPPQ